MKVREWFLLFIAGLMFLVGLGLPVVFAQDALSARDAFDHSDTGYLLDAAHVSVPCEFCHWQAQFRGTPRDCASCHRPGGRASGKTPSHPPTTVACDACHLSMTWAPAVFQHQTSQGVVQGGCITCHNGAFAEGKPVRHVITASACDSCHRTSAWLPAAYTHALVVPGGCVSCHDGRLAQGKSPGHIPSSSSCDQCHQTGAVFAPISVSVGAMHSAMTAPPAAGSCVTCHDGSYLLQNAQVKSANHVATVEQCDVCHASTSSWATATYSHSGADTNCSGCHSGPSGSAMGPPGNHVPSGAQQCDVCHKNYSAFKPATMDHAGTAGQCSGCHNGAYTFANAQGMAASHVPTTMQCDSCHLGAFVAWLPVAMNHAGQAGKCSTCHGGAFLLQNAQSKPPTHISTTAQCDSCHTSTSSWAMASFDHVAASPPVAGRCSSCHNGVSAMGKSATHIPTSAQCDLCHAHFNAFRPAQMNHAGLVGQCSGCHNGSYLFANALARPVTHIPTSGQCDLCHVSGFVSFSPATMNHAGLSGLCSACHGGAYLAQNAQTKHATHVVTTAQCDTCHGSTTSWASAVIDHAAVTPAVAGRCSSCHGSTALGKPSTHVPTTAQCDVCHVGFGYFAPATTNHGGTVGPVAAGNCVVCHGGTYVAVGAQAKPTTHVPTAASCDDCHSTVAWVPSTYSHPASGVCANCHNGATAQGKPVSHIPTTAACDVCHLNSTAFAPAGMSHVGTSGPVAAGNCVTCHSGSYLAVNAQVKPPTHVVTSAQCDDCHASTTTWATVSFSHGAGSTNCSGCHGVTALGKPGTHVPTSAQCSVCHVNFTAFQPATMNHASTSGPVAAGNCSSCHNGGYTAVNARAKPGNHLPTTSSCDVCHQGTTAWLPISFGHAGVVAGTCQTCHGGAYANITAKPGDHFPTTASCDACHQGTVAWSPASFNHSGVASGTCQTCHGGAYPGVTVKPGNHIPTTTPAGMPGNECSLCHSSTSSFATERMNHGTMQTSCVVCHDSTASYLGSMDKKSSSHEQRGTTDCSSSRCHAPLGSEGRAYSTWD